MQPLDAQALLSQALFLDVREPYEYEAGHIEGSLHIPIGQIQQRWTEVPSDRPVVVVCQVGQRSGLVAGFLQSRGFDAHNLEGGLDAWSQAGLDLASSDTSPEVIDGWARDLSGNRLGPTPPR